MIRGIALAGLLCVLGPTAGLGQTAAVQGTVVDSATATPLSLVRVEILRGAVRSVTTTDEHGRFRLSGIPTGIASLRITRIGYRPAGQSRVALAVAGGIEDGRAALRAQLTAQFLVTPAARRGAGLYGGLGVAVTGRRGSPGGGYLALLVGLEAAPGRRAGGWYAELGLAGGARIAAGWRGRWFPGWWRG